MSFPCSSPKIARFMHGASMGPIWGRQDPGGPHVGSMNLAISAIASDYWKQCKCLMIITHQMVWTEFQVLYKTILSRSFNKRLNSVIKKVIYSTYQEICTRFAICCILLRLCTDQFIPISCNPLQWRHNGGDCVSNPQPHGCLLNRLFGHRSKKTSKLRVTGFCSRKFTGNHWIPRTNGQLRGKRFSFTDVIMLTTQTPEQSRYPTKTDNETTTRSNTWPMNKHIFISIWNLDINSCRKKVGKSQDKIWKWINLNGNEIRHDAIFSNDYCITTPSVWINHII